MAGSQGNATLSRLATRSSKPAVRFIFITLMLDVLGFGLLIPVAPLLVEQVLHPPTVATEAEAAPYVGALQSTFYVMAFLFAPALGALSDRIGRRPVILISLLGSGVDYFAMAMAPSITWLFATRVINGLTGASYSVATAYVADVTPPEKRAASFGLIGAAFGLGFVIGPVVGGMLGAVNIRLPFVVAGCLTLVNWLYGMFVLPESLPKENRSQFRWRRANPVGAFFLLRKYPLVMGMAISLFLMNMAQFALHATWALSMQHRFDWTPVHIGMSLAMVGVCAAIVQGGIVRRLVPALGERRSLMLGLAMGVLAYIGYGAATQGWMIFAVIAVGSIAAISQPAGQALITREVSPNEQGAIQGALASLMSLAGIFGPILGGATLAYFIQSPPPMADAPIDMVGANFYLSALIAVLGWIAAAWAVRHHGERREVSSKSVELVSSDSQPS
jgi:MFS transporter, DHA1 family, tetracycline resistance protein